MTPKGDAPRSQLGLAGGVRRLAVLVLALVLPAVALAANTDPQERFTVADKRKAAGLVLKRSDFVAGWKQTPPTPDDPSEFECSGAPDQSDLVLTGEAEANFVSAQGVPLVFSVANLYKTRSQAVAGWTRSVAGPVVRCMTQAIEQGFSDRGATAKVTRKGTIPFPRYAARGAAYRFSFQIAQSANGQTTTLPFTMHIVVLGRGRGDVMLMSMGVGNGVALAELKRLARVTAQRLAAASL